jgi:DNA-binding response OmpR family regulator
MNRIYHILVVDDDREVRDVLAVALSAPGISVLTASDAFEAVRVLVERPVHLMVIDIRMPHMNGFELARQARLMRPQMQFIFISGYYRHEDVIPDRVEGTLLQKPFRPSELRGAVQRELQIEPLVPK